MIRFLLWIGAGLVLGLIVHLAVILVLPNLATRDIWSRIVALDALAKVQVLDPVAAAAPNPLHLDPELTYGICRLDLADGPGVLTGQMPSAFWSLGVFDDKGIAIYSTTNRSGIGNHLDLGIFNPTQTRLLAEKEFRVEEGLLIVEAQSNQVFVVVRLAPPYPQMAQRYREALSAIDCGNIAVPAPTSDTQIPG